MFNKKPYIKKIVLDRNLKDRNIRAKGRCVGPEDPAIAHRAQGHAVCRCPAMAGHGDGFRRHTGKRIPPALGQLRG